MSTTQIDYLATARKAERDRFEQRRLTVINEAYSVLARTLGVSEAVARNDLQLVKTHVSRRSVLNDCVVLRRHGGSKQVVVNCRKVYRHSRFFGTGLQLSATALAKRLAR